MTAPVFLADADVLHDLAPGGTVGLSGPEGHHAAVVRRLRVGEELVLTDGRGCVVDGIVSSVGRDGLAVTASRCRREPAPNPTLTVVQGVPKGDRGELAVEQLVEVGVDRIVPWWAERCVTQWRGDRAAKGLHRWRSAAREAGKQSRRWWAAEVTEPRQTADVSRLLAGGALAVVLHEDAEAALGSLTVPAVGELVLVVGPEGGISDEERAAFERVGAVAARLGPTVLRTSTAGAVAAGLVLSRTSRWSFR